MYALPMPATNLLSFSCTRTFPMPAFTGFTGGAAKKLADISIHVDVHNYGIVEDLHQGMMHIVAQYLRQKALPDDDVKNEKF